jgi:DNA topoisomerase IA
LSAVAREDVEKAAEDLKAVNVEKVAEQPAEKEAEPPLDTTTFDTLPYSGML